MDLNVRVIKAVECCPTLYKGHASIEERQVVWQQLAEQMRVPESVLKTRWHLLCNWYQRCLEKRRSTDEAKDSEAGADSNVFTYEAEMAFMMPYIHARITIAAANAARKQHELALAGANDLTEPEFVITESDIEQATTTAGNELSDDYTFYEVETFKQEPEDLTDGGGGVGVGAIIETAHDELGENNYIQQIDESGNIVVQDIIYEAGDQLSEEGGEIEIEDEELLQMDDQIEVQNEQIIEEVVEDEAHANDENEYITDTYDVMPTETTSPRTLRLPVDRGKKYIKVIELKPDKDVSTIPATKPANTEESQSQASTSPSLFAQEYSLTTRRRHAVVLKATPRVQVELTDNAAASVVLQQRVNGENAVGSSTSRNFNDRNNMEIETATTTTAKPLVIEEEPVKIQIDETKNKNVEMKNQELTKPITSTQEQVSTINSTASITSPTLTSTSSTSAPPAETVTPDASKNVRSEDTIFGELVAAMLKEMPSERKRVIKKSIMDLLLT